MFSCVIELLHYLPSFNCKSSSNSGMFKLFLLVARVTNLRSTGGATLIFDTELVSVNGKPSTGDADADDEVDDEEL